MTKRIISFLLLAVFISICYAASFNTTVGASSDDAHESAAGAVNLTAITCIRPKSAMDWAGARFLNVTIPQGATINTATTTTRVTLTGDLDVTIFAQAIDDAGTFTTTTSDISSRTRTTASVEWDASVTNGDSPVTPDFSAVMQEVINRAGWASGNDIVFIYRINTNSTSRTVSWDDTSLPEHTLDVTYTVAGGRRRQKAIFFQ